MAIYTEFRILHSDAEEKSRFNSNLDEAIKKLGYANRVEWVRDMYRRTLDKAKEV
jgi:metal-responsive CopG/Arc/MetJ family transcriptional regulator